MFKRLRRLLAPALVTAATVLGTTFPTFAGAPLLVVRNLVEPSHPEARLTAAELRAMPQVTIRTHTEFTDGVVTFVGPLARDVVARVGVGPATTVHAIAANDYSVDFPLEDLFKYDVILAMKMNGKRLTLRDKGPLWIMYPLDDHAELRDPIYNQRLIWQLTTLELK